MTHWEAGTSEAEAERERERERERDFLLRQKVFHCSWKKSRVQLCPPYLECNFSISTILSLCLSSANGVYTRWADSSNNRLYRWSRQSYSQLIIVSPATLYMGTAHRQTQRPRGQ